MSFNQNIAEQYGLTIFESEAPDREVIDFSVYNSDIDDNVAWAWGGGDTVAVDNKEYNYDYEVECNHKIEWGGDDERGYCVVCGKECDWHWEKEWVDDGHGEDGECIGHYEQHRVPHEWHEGDGGIIKQYINEQRRKYGNKQTNF